MSASTPNKRQYDDDQNDQHHPNNGTPLRPQQYHPSNGAPPQPNYYHPNNGTPPHPKQQHSNNGHPPPKTTQSLQLNNGTLSQTNPPWRQRLHPEYQDLEQLLKSLTPFNPNKTNATTRNSSKVKSEHLKQQQARRQNPRISSLRQKNTEDKGQQHESNTKQR